jgi:hypothetical protein
MPAPLIAAGLTAVGSVVGGIAGGKGAKKAAQIQAQSTRDQIAAIERNQAHQYNINAPTIAHGTAADDRIAALLRLGGDGAAADAAYNAWRDSTGYQTVLNEALRSTNNGSFAGGSGMSGSALQRLQERGATIANGTFNNYMGHLGGVSATGAGARGIVAGVGNNSTNMMVNAQQTGAQGQINAVNAQTANTQNMIQNLVNSGQFALGQFGYGSSYKPMGQSGYAPGAGTIYVTGLPTTWRW